MRALLLLAVAIGASGCYEVTSYSPAAYGYNPTPYVPRNTFGDYIVYGSTQPVYQWGYSPRHYYGY